MGAVAASYEVRWRLRGSNGAWSTRIFPARGDSVELTGLERGQTYDIEARALSEAGTPSDWVPVTVLVADATLAPRAPTNLTAQSVADGVALSWQVDAEQAAGVEYIVERATAETGPFSALTRVRALQYTDPVTDQVVRWYRVRAVNFQGVISAPTLAVNSNGKASSVLISETAPANPAVGTQWHQPSTNLTRVWNGSGWSLMSDNSLVTQITANLVTNGGFEAGATGWALAANASIDAAAKYLGTMGLRHAANGGALAQSASNAFAVSAGERIVAESYIYSASANGTASLAIWFYDAAGNPVSGGGPVNSYANGQAGIGSWRKVVGVITVPSNAHTAKIGLETSGHTTGAWYADQFRALKQPQVEVQPCNLVPNANFGGINGDKAPWVLAWNPNNANIERFLSKKEGLVGPSWSVEGATGQLEVSQVGRTGGSPGVVDFHCGTSSASLMSVLPSQRYELHCKIAAHGCDVTIGVVWYDSNQTTITSETASYARANGGKVESLFAQIGGFFIAPSNAAFARMFLRKTDTDAGRSDSFAWFIKPYFGPAKIDQKEFSPWVPGPTYTADEVPTGNFGVVSTADLWDAGGMRRVGLRVHGSGHRLGSQSNAPQSLTTAYGSVRNTTALTASSDGSVSVNAHTVRYGGFSVSYNAVANAVTGLTQSTRYVIYCFDPDYTGGTKTWFAGPNPDAVMQLGDGVVIAGEVTIPTSGTGSGGGGGGGPGDGGGEWCVDATMRLPDGRIAGDIAAGDIIACWDEDADTPGVQERDVESNTLVESQPCTRIMTVSGAAVVASDCTPMTLRDGRIVRITEMFGEGALVRHADGTLAWEPVVSCTAVGSRTVAKIKVHQLCYFAGESAAATIATHNPIMKP